MYMCIVELKARRGKWRNSAVRGKTDEKKCKGSKCSFPLGRETMTTATKKTKKNENNKKRKGKGNQIL